MMCVSHRLKREVLGVGNNVSPTLVKQGCLECFIYGFASLLLRVSF